MLSLALLVATAALPLATLIGSALRYRSGWQAVRQERAAGPTRASVRVTVVEIGRLEPARPQAVIYRPRFGERSPVRPRALRAAA